MNYSSYAELAVQLANAAVQAPGEPDPLGTLGDCASALGDCLTGPVTRRDLDVLRHLRHEFTAIFTAAATGADSDAMERLNALLLQFPIQPEMTSHDDEGWHIHLAPQGAAADLVAARAIFGLALTVSASGVSRLGICAIASCPRVFIDTGQGRSRRYCGEHSGPGVNVRTLHKQLGGPSAAPGGSMASPPEHAAPAAS